MPTSKQKFLRHVRACFKQWQDADQKQHDRETEALRFYGGDQWPKDIWNSRQTQTIGSGTTSQTIRGLPCLVVNKTREPVRQILNQERQSDMGIELVPADDFGEMAGPIDHTEIELREGLIRRIQRDSEAADARSWAFQRAVIAGRGYWGVMTRYAPGKTTDQEVFIQRFYDQGSVGLDPMHEQPDGSDAEWGLVGAYIGWDQYKAEYPLRAGRPNRLTNCTNTEWLAFGEQAPEWFTTDGDLRSVLVVDYYYTERTTKTLAMFPDGRAEWVKDLPEDIDPKSYTTRDVIQKSIKWAKIDGCDDDVLDETDWPGHYIPIIKVVGEELQPYDQERRCEGIVQPAMDSCRGFNYMVSKWVGDVGLSPYPSWMMAVGQDETLEAEYQASTTRAVGVLHYNQTDADGRPAPPPFRAPMSADYVGPLAASVEMFNNAILSTTGVPEASLGHVDPTLKSGKAIRAVLQQAERGTSNFLDNLVRSMRHEARIVNDLLYPIYGQRPGRLARMMNPSGKMEAVLVKQPFVVQGEGVQARPMPAQPGQPDAKLYQLTPDAEWNVAVKVSKNFDTRREQEAAITGEIIANDPQQLQVIGDLFFKNQDGPGHDEMAKRYETLLLPPIQAMLKKGQPPIPPEVQQQMQQMQEQMQQLTELADKNKASLMEAQMKTQADLQRTQMELASREKIALIQATTAITNTQSKIDAEDARTFVDALENRLAGQLNLHMDKLGKIHEAITQSREQDHEVGMAHLQAALTPEPIEGNGTGAE